MAAPRARAGWRALSGTERHGAARRPLSPERLALAALFAGAAAIAFAPIFVRLSEIGPVATAFYRLAFALPVLWLWMGLEHAAHPARRRPGSRRDYLRLAAAGVFFAGDLALWHGAILLTSVANATLFANFAPVFVTLGAWFLFGQRASATFVAGLATAVGGAVLLIGDSVALSLRNVAGDAMGLLTAVFYGAYLLSVSRLRAEFSTATIMAWSAAATCACLLVLAMVLGEPLIALSAGGWAVLAALALVSHVGGQGLIAYALAHLPAPFSSVGLLLQPVLAAALAWWLLGEALRPWQLAGGLVVLAGIALARRGSRPVSALAS